MSEGQRQNWFESNPGKAKLLVFLLCLGFLEVLARAGVAAGWLPYWTYATNREPQYWVDIDPIVGRWRFPNTHFHNTANCIDVDYETNSVGARDRERSVRSDANNRVIVLGDSFAEGWGVDVDDRISNLLETATGIEHLNFGTASWGTIQQWQYYKHYARRYDHSAVFLFAFPQNDFADNNPDLQDHSFYRPYLRKTEGAYEIFYTVKFDERNTSERPAYKAIKNAIDNKIYLANVARRAVRLFKERRVKPITEPETDYDKFSEADIELFLYVLSRIAALAEDRRLYIITIPTEKDFEAAKANDGEFELIRKLRSFAKRTHNVDIVDLAPHFLSDATEFGRAYEDYTFSCDRHWGALGNRVAADAILEAVYGLPGANAKSALHKQAEVTASGP